VNIDRVVLTGNLTADPELRPTPNGTPVARLRLAVNTRRRSSSTGTWDDKPNYFDVTVWGAQAENCARYLSKGRPVAVDGRLEWREYEARDGGKRQAVEIIAESVQFLGRTPDAQAEPRAHAREPREDEGAPPVQPSSEVSEDEIPF
jgi:single-strand DNA-binding protein